MSFSRDAMSMSNTPMKVSEGLSALDRKRPSRTKSFVNRKLERSPTMIGQGRRPVERTKTLNVSVRSRSNSVLSHNDVQKVQRIQDILNSIRSKDEVPWPATVSASERQNTKQKAAEETPLRVPVSSKDATADRHAENNNDVSNIVEENTDDMNNSSKAAAESPLLFR